jgi:type IV fimbrial biogenesis protein FimT
MLSKDLPFRLRNSGFTLIELMIVLALLAILLSMAMPGFTRWIANTKVRATAESVQNGLMLAKAEAVASNRKVQFALTTTEPVKANETSITTSLTGTNWMVRAATPGSTTYGTNSFVQGRSLTEGSQNVLINAGSAATGCTRQQTIVFTGLGFVSPVPASGVLLCIDVSSAASDRPLRITVERGGAIRMCDPGLSLANTTMGCPP